MRFRKLRIAWSVFWGLACLLLILLWVRSYWWHDYCRGAVVGMQGVYFDSAQGRIGAAVFTPGFTEWTSASQPIDQALSTIAMKLRDDLGLGFGTTRFGNICTYLAPHWFFILITAALQVAPWLRWRFSLRTLLIATTLVAVVLGLIVWAAK